ncbi:MAG: hypothetical protein ACR2P0_08950 [Acidimicrobiales bacterium]
MATLGELREALDTMAATPDASRAESAAAYDRARGAATIRRRFRRGLLAVAAMVVLAGTTGVFFSLSDGGQDGTTVSTESADDAGSPMMSVAEGQALMEVFIDSVQVGDADTARSLVMGNTPGPDFLGWWIALDTTSVDFFDCEYRRGSVSCQITVGAEHWYPRVHGQIVAQTFTATLEGGFVVDPSAPFTSIDFETEAEFQTWALDMHPELADVLFDRSSPAGVAYTVEGGEARMQLLGEFLMYRQSRALMDNFVKALQAGDPDRARSMVVGNDLFGPDFVGWFVSLDTTDLDFFDCEFPPGAVSCQTTLGAGHWFERIHGEHTEVPFSAIIDDGTIVDPIWPARPADLAAERGFRAWAEEAHPEMNDVMFDDTSLGVVFTVESGLARSALLEEYLASI